jgi:hypothetical protein
LIYALDHSRAAGAIDYAPSDVLAEGLRWGGGFPVTPVTGLVIEGTGVEAQQPVAITTVLSELPRRLGLWSGDRVPPLPLIIDDLERVLRPGSGDSHRPPAMYAGGGRTFEAAGMRRRYRAGLP